MTKGQFTLTLMVTAIFAMLGGAAVNMLGMNSVAAAQDSGKPKSTRKPPSDDAKGKIITAKEFRLLGDDGKVVARLKTATHREMGEQVMFVLSDAGGKERVRLYAAEKATGLELCDEEGKARVALSQTSLGGPASKCSMQINDADAKPKILFDYTSFGALNCYITNVNGAGAQLFASVFKDKPLLQLVGNGGGEVWKAPP